MDEYKENKGFVGAIKMVNEEEYTSVDFYKENSQNKWWRETIKIILYFSL